MKTINNINEKFTDKMTERQFRRWLRKHGFVFGEGFKSEHLGDEELMAEMKSHEGNVSVQSIALKVDYRRGANGGVIAATGVQSIQQTPANRDYMVDNVKLYSTVKRTVYKRGSKNIVVVDYSAAARTKKGRGMVVNFLMDGFYVRELKDHLAVYMGDEKRGVFAELTGKRDEATGDLPKIKASELKSKDGSFKSTVRHFGGKRGCSIGTPSQGRKCQMTFYVNTTQADCDTFLRRADAATNGMFSMDRGIVTGLKGAAELNNREGQKSTAMGLNMGCSIPCYAYSFTKDGNTDGAFFFNSVAIARNIMQVRGVPYSNEAFEELERKVRGYLLQARPYSIKAAGLVITDAAIKMLLSKKKYLVVDVTTASQETLDAVNLMLCKVLRDQAGIKVGKPETYPEPLKGYEGVIINHGDPDEEVGFIADLNAVKNHYDLKSLSGANVMAVAHADRFDEKRAGTSAQLMKIVLRAVKDAADPELSKEFRKAMVNIITRQLEEHASYGETSATIGHGEKMILTDYVAGAARDLFSREIEKHPVLFKGVMEDIQRRLQNAINFDRYATAGHFGMITADPAYTFAGKTLLNMTADYVEVYDPVFFRYAKEHHLGKEDNNGIAIKHPSMGTREFLYILYVSEEEMARRVNALECDKDVKDVLRGIYATLKEGAVLIPAHLAAIAAIAAGSDEDGDKMGFHFIDVDAKGEHYDLVKVMWESGMKMRAVLIGNDNEANAKSIVIGPDTFQAMAVEMLLAGNHGVGQVTNTFRILDEGLLIGEKETKRMHVFKSVFADVLGKNGHGAYVSPIKKADSSVIGENIPGLVVCCTPSDVVDRFAKACGEMELTTENILVALDDADIIGRHVQELTIDAQKKFYQVVCDLIDELSKRFSILPLNSGVIFNLNLEAGSKSQIALGSNVDDCAGYVMVDGKIHNRMTYVAPRGKNVITVMSDAFAPFRTFAANKALELLNGLRKVYFDVAESDEMVRARNAEYSNLLLLGPSPVAQEKVQHVVSLAKTVNHLYNDYCKALRHEFIDGCELDRSEELKVSGDIRKAAYEKFNDVFAEVDNQIRVIAEDNDIDPFDLVVLIAHDKDVESGVLGKLLKEETVKYLAEKSGRVFTFDLSPEAFADEAEYWTIREMDQVSVKDGKIDGTDVKVPLVNGEYSLDLNDDETLTLWRSVSEFVEVPAADHSMLTFGSNKLTDTSAIDAVEAGDTVSLVATKEQGKGDVVNLVDGNGNTLFEVWCGSKKKFVGNRSIWKINSEMFAGKTGTVKDVNVTVNKDGVSYAVVTIDNIVETPQQDAAEEIADFYGNASDEELEIELH